MRVSIKLSWCELGQDLVDMLFLHFHWVSGASKVVLDFSVPHLLPVTVRVQNLTQLVIVIARDNFTHAFNVVEAFVWWLCQFDALVFRHHLVEAGHCQRDPICFSW